MSIKQYLGCLTRRVVLQTYGEPGMALVYHRAEGGSGAMTERRAKLPQIENLVIDIPLFVRILSDMLELPKAWVK